MGVDEFCKISPGHPSVVVDAYLHALLGRYPRVRYLVGKDAKVMLFLQALPEWMSDRFLAQFVGSRLPLPQSVKKNN